LEIKIWKVKKVYVAFRHPLFPILKLIVEKCELATNSHEFASQENFNKNIKQVIDDSENTLNKFNEQDEQLNELVS
jgi:hypothetical protein